MHQIVLLIHWDAVINGNPVEKVFFYCTKSVLSRETSLIGCELVDKHNWIQESHTPSNAFFSRITHIYSTSHDFNEKKSFDWSSTNVVTVIISKENKEISQWIFRLTISVVKWIFFTNCSKWKSLLSVMLSTHRLQLFVLRKLCDGHVGRACERPDL